jgi:hypothetical protein
VQAKLRRERAKAAAQRAEDDRWADWLEEMYDVRPIKAKAAPAPKAEVIPFPSKQARRNAWFKKRAERDPVWRLNRNTRNAVYQSLKGLKRGQRWTELVGYTLEDLRQHIEKQFVDGMAWHNIGEWHVDHIRPMASFNITGPDCPGFKAAWALENLQPLWARDNIRKGARWQP